ncbi:hypothetical protein BKA69DRAFT_1130524 [Paraphysoderma sedebokerense]|nr:hypothetical protein BKA69DRAFT_1130524 [Paraphysoderma sedebokerense]
MGGSKQPYFPDKDSTTVSLPLNALESLLSQLSDQNELAFPGYLLKRLKLNGEAAEEGISFKCMVTVSVLAASTTCIPLFGIQASVISSEIIFPANPSIGLDDSPKKAQASRLSYSPSSNSNDVGSSANSNTYDLTVVNERVGFVTTQPGDYLLNLNLFVPYDSNHGKLGRSITDFRIPKCARNECQISVEDQSKLGVDIKVEPSHNIKRSKTTTRVNKVNLAESFLESESAELIKPTPIDVDLMCCTFPPTDKLQVLIIPKSSDEASDAAVQKETPKRMISIDQTTGVSITETEVKLTTEIQYTVHHGTVTFLEVMIDSPELRVIGVEGADVLSWDIDDVENVVPGSASPKPGLASINLDPPEFTITSLSPSRNRTRGTRQNGGGREKRIRVKLKYNDTGNGTIVIMSELENKSSRIQVPSFMCKNVDREKGHVAVESTPNLEIAESSSSRLDRIDIKELPNSMSFRSPILLAYRFLATGYQLSLDFKKHGDVSVLIAIIDSALVEATACEGRMLVKCTLTMRNTQKQYLRVRIPDRQSVEIWSATVADTAVKPWDEEGLVLIPLEKSSSADQGPFNVELVYMVPLGSVINETLGKADRGDFKFELPVFDIPISKLFTRLYLPSDYKFSTFAGDMREVSRFSDNPPSANDNVAIPRGGANSNVNDEMYQMKPMPQMAQMAYTQNMIPVAQTMRMPKKLPSKSVKGIVPVKISNLSVGTPFLFERLLVQSESLYVKTSFKRLPIPKHLIRDLGERKVAMGWLIALSLLMLFILAHFMVSSSASCKDFGRMVWELSGWDIGFVCKV